MKIIKNDLGADINKIKIIPIADTHIGEKECNLKDIQKVISQIKNSDDTYAILNGDLLNTAIKTSVSDVYSETMTVQEQLDTIVEMFDPIKDKILGVIAGNHENRILSLTGIDVIKNFCYRLGIVDKYAVDAYLIFVSFGMPFETRPNRRYTYSIFGRHGSGGGSTIGSKLNKVKKMSDVVDADVYLHSHTHLPAAFRDMVFRICTRTKTIRELERLYVNTNAFLNYGGYGEEKGFTPASRQTVSIEMDGNGIKSKI